MRNVIAYNGKTPYRRPGTTIPRCDTLAPARDGIMTFVWPEMAVQIVNDLMRQGVRPLDAIRSVKRQLFTRAS